MKVEMPNYEFRPLPTPEQIRAHGEGGLWSTDAGTEQYRFWDRPAGEPWYDCTPLGVDVAPWPQTRYILRNYFTCNFLPLHPDGTPRDWAEIDAIVARSTSSVAITTEPKPDYRAPTDAELRMHGGCWQAKDGTFCDVWVNSTLEHAPSHLRRTQTATQSPTASGQLVGYYHNKLPAGRTTGWLIDDNVFFARDRRELRPVNKQGKPIAWESLATKPAQTAQPAQAVSQADTEWRPLPDTETLRRHPWWVSVGEGLETNYIRTTSEGTYALTEQAAQPPLPRDGDPMTVASAVAIAREGARQALDSAVFDAVTATVRERLAQELGYLLDCFAAAWYNTTRKPNETDEQLRQRCRDLWTSPEKLMSPGNIPPLPDFTKMSPEDRARYRAALDAVDPPTTRDAIRSGLEHAPVEIALDKLHNFVAKLANLWTEGSEEDRQTAARFLRDMVGSDYGKAAIGLAAGAALPHAAPLANKLLPDDKDAAPLLRRIGYILAERGAATGAKQLGLDIMDATGPIVVELRSLLGELLSGMRKADAVAGLLPPASPRLNFDGTLTVESEVKR